MTPPINIRELRKVCVQRGCKVKKKQGKNLCPKHQAEYDRKSNPEPKNPDPRYKDLE